MFKATFQPMKNSGDHLEYRARSQDTNLEKDHPSSSTSKFGRILA